MPLRDKDLVNQVYLKTISIIENYDPKKTENLNIRSYFILQSKFTMLNYCRKYNSKTHRFLSNCLSYNKFEFLIKSDYNQTPKISNYYAKQKLNETEYLLYDYIVNQDMNTNQIVASKHFTRIKLNLVIQNIWNKIFA